MRLRASISAIAAVLSVTMIADVASAACTRLSFSVNDYGKDGPTKDAKDLLDKYIAKTMAERGIKTYRVGKKDVTCELFLDFGFFDEHTCKAAAVVCWGDSTPGAAKEATAPAAPAGGAAPAKAEAKKPAAAKAKAKPKEAAAAKAQ